MVVKKDAMDIIAFSNCNYLERTINNFINVYIYKSLYQTVEAATDLYNVRESKG